MLPLIKSGVSELRDGNMMGATFSKAKAKAQGKGKGTPLVFTWKECAFEAVSVKAESMRLQKQEHSFTWTHQRVNS